MTRCRGCGEALLFRYIDGRNVPLGCKCSAWEGSLADGLTIRHLTPYRAYDSYVIPNAHCPVCKKKVFYYQNEQGSKVYFDQLGPPWPKHPCTDTTPPASSSSSVTFKPKHYARPKEHPKEWYYHKGRKKRRFPQYPPFKWPINEWHPFRITQILVDESPKYRYYTLTGIVNYDEFSLTIAPERPLKFSETNPFFVRLSNDQFEISTIIETKGGKAAEYWAVGFRDPLEAAKVRGQRKQGQYERLTGLESKTKTPVKPKETPKYLPVKNLSSMNAQTKILRRPNPDALFTEYFSSGKTQSIQLEDLRPPWKQFNAKSKQPKKAKGWKQVQVVKIQRLDNLLALKLRLNNDRSVWVQIATENCPYNLSRPIFIKRKQDGMYELSTIQIVPRHGLKTFYITCLTLDQPFQPEPRSL